MRGVCVGGRGGIGGLRLTDSKNARILISAVDPPFSLLPTPKRIEAFKISPGGGREREGRDFPLFDYLCFKNMIRRKEEVTGSELQFLA